MPIRHASSAPAAERSPNGRDPASADAAERRVRVLLPLPLLAPYDYRVPAGLDFAPGDFVAVPLGRRNLAGVVWDDAPPAGGAIVGARPAKPVESARLKDVIGALPAPPLPAVSRRFIDWVAGYTLAPPG